MPLRAYDCKIIKVAVVYRQNLAIFREKGGNDVIIDFDKKIAEISIAESIIACVRRMEKPLKSSPVRRTLIIAASGSWKV